MAKLTRKLAVIDEENFSLSDLTFQSIIAQQMAYEQSAEKKEYRNEGFHLSSKLTLPFDDPRFCSRELEIMRRFAKDIPPWRPDPALQVILDIGNEAHSLVQKYWRDFLFCPGNKVGLYGQWTCRRCETIWFDFSPQKCLQCDAPLNRIKYLEYRFDNKKYDIKSTTDGLLWIYNASLKEWFEYIIEVKTIKENAFFFGDIGFNQLQKPMDKHIIQAQGYGFLRYIEHRNGMKKRKLPKGFSVWPTFKKEIIFFYVNKNGGRQPFKEYRVALDKSIWSGIRERIWLIQAHEDNNSFSKRIKKCKILTDAKKICDVAELCFRL
jgi:hypothetical protein